MTRLIYSLRGIPALVLAVSGNLFLAGMFFTALRSPLEHETLMSVTTFIILIIEFCNLFLSRLVMSGGSAMREVEKMTLSHAIGIFKSPNMWITVYLIGGVVLTAAVFKHLFLAYYFVIGLAAKFFGARAAQDESREITSWILFILTIFTFLIIPLELYQTVLPFPEEVIRRHKAGPASDFAPQAPLMWGLMYFSLLALVDIVIFLKKNRRYTDMQWEISSKIRRAPEV